MRRDLLAKRSCRFPVSIRLGLSLVLGMLAVLLLASLLVVASPPLAQTAPPNPGDLDTTFGTTGIVTTPVGGSGQTHSVAIQEDGKIVVAGQADSGSGTDFAVARYTVSGTLDTSFGTGGIVTTPIGGDDQAYGVAIQEDGKIVVVGHAYSGSNDDFALARYTVSGTLDTTFGTGGIVTTPIGTSSDRGSSVAIQEDGKIVVAGESYYSSGQYHFAVVRYTVSGTLDAAFGTGGVMTTSITPGYDVARSVAIQEDDKIVVAGSADAYNPYFAVIRYTPSGALDTTFGSGGVVTTHIGPDDNPAHDIAIQGDGKIVVVGEASNGGNDDFALARYTISGTLDTSFGSSGVVTTPISPGADRAYGIVIQANDKIVAAGWGHDGFALVRYAISGTLDTTFGTGGIVTTPIGSDTSVANDVALQADGKIVAAGWASNGSDQDFALARYHGDPLPPSLTVLKDAAGAGGSVLNLPPGGVVTYTIVLSNSGGLTATGVTMTDELPDAVRFGGWLQQGSAQPPSPTDIITWTGDVAPHTDLTIRFTATITSSLAFAGETINNTASFTSTDADSGSADATFTVADVRCIYLPLVLRNA